MGAMKKIHTELTNRGSLFRFPWAERKAMGRLIRGSLAARATVIEPAPVPVVRAGTVDGMRPRPDQDGAPWFAPGEPAPTREEWAAWYGPGATGDRPRLNGPYQTRNATTGTPDPASGTPGRKLSRAERRGPSKAKVERIKASWPQVDVNNRPKWFD